MSNSPFAALILGEPGNLYPDRQIEPLVRFHLQNADGLFYCFDRYGDSLDEFFSEFTSAFICEWDTPELALRRARPGMILRVSIDGVLK